MSARIRLLVEGVHMGLSHDGLARLLKTKLKLDITELADGDLIMFINRRGDKMKTYGARGLVIGYLKMPDGNRIMKDALQYIPRTFGAKGFDYDAACKAALDARLQKHYTMKTRKPVSPLTAYRKSKEQPTSHAK